MKKTIRLISLAMVAVMLCLALVSCGGPNADPDKALEGLRKNEYVALKLIVDPFKLINKDITDTVAGGKGSDYIVICYFEETDDAKEAEADLDKLKATVEDIVSYIGITKDDIKDSEIVSARSGKLIYFGTKNAVKAAK